VRTPPGLGAAVTALGAVVPGSKAEHGEDEDRTLPQRHARPRRSLGVRAFACLLVGLVACGPGTPDRKADLVPRRLPPTPPDTSHDSPCGEIWVPAWDEGLRWQSFALEDGRRFSLMEVWAAPDGDRRESLQTFEAPFDVHGLCALGRNAYALVGVTGLGEAVVQVWRFRDPPDDPLGEKELDHETLYLGRELHDPGPLQVGLDGSYLLFVASDAESAALWKLALEGGTPPALVDRSASLWNREMNSLRTYRNPRWGEVWILERIPRDWSEGHPTVLYRDRSGHGDLEVVQTGDRLYFP